MVGCNIWFQKNYFLEIASADRVTVTIQDRIHDQVKE